MTPFLSLWFSTVLITFTYPQYFLGKKPLSATAMLVAVTEEKSKYSPGFRVPEVVNGEIRLTFTANVNLYHVTKFFP